MTKWIQIVLVSTLVLLSFSECSAVDHQDSLNESQGFRWKREESYFVDYTISGDMVQFRYAFCFENSSEDDVSLSSLVASFKKAELREWLAYEKCYNGVLENGANEVVIPAGEKIDVVFVFSGKYLGGSVNDNLSVPDITMIMNYV